MKYKILTWIIGIFFLMQLAYAEEVYFNNPGNETLHDAYTSEAAKDTTYDNTNLIVATNIYDSYVQWALNTSMFPANTKVLECYANFTISTSEGTTYNDIKALYVNATFDETTLTYNTAPCTVDASVCIQTPLDTITIPSGASGMFSFNITPACKWAIGNQTGNITILFGNTSSNGENQIFYSKDSGQPAADLPGLQIIYIGTPTAEDLQQFTVTAKDEYDGSALSNITLIISNSSNKYTFSTENGTIYIQNRTIEKFGVSYKINITSNQSNGYFNITYNNINISDGGSKQFNIAQSYISINVTDTISGMGLSSFTVYTNYSSHSGTNGNIILATKEGYHIFNITSSQYPLQEYSYTIGVKENLTFYANISPSFNFYLRREADNSVFDIESTNSTKLTIYCPNKNIIITFRNNTYNSTEENATVDCQFTYMKIDVTYDDSSYFRTLIPETSQQNVTWWLLDLTKDTGVQKILQLVDLTGEWSSGLMRIKTAIDQNNEDIIEQEFDISTGVILYLLKDSLYTISIENNDRTKERQLGSLIADSAGTTTITYPNIPFYPENTVLADNISWSYYFNTTTHILRLQYQDTTSSTEEITWKIYNGSNTSLLLQQFTSTSSDITFTYQPVYENLTYFTTLFIQHELLDFNITENKVFGYTPPPSDFEGWTPEEESNIKLYGSVIFLVIWGLLFTAKHAGIGLGSTFIWLLIFRGYGWMPISKMWLSLLGFLAVASWIYEGWRKN